MFMEMTNNDSRFNLISFCSGGARRHPPLRSVFTLLFCICFCLFSSPFSAFATAPIIDPELTPIVDTDFSSIQESYLNLNPAAQAAGAILMGAYVTEYAGLADYGTVFDSIPTDGSVWDRLQFVGQQCWDTIMLPFNMANQLVVQPIYDLCSGIICKVNNVSSVSDFQDLVMNSDYYGLPYSPELGDSLNQFFALHGGLNEWQQGTVSYNSADFPFTWNTFSISGSTLSSYESVFLSMTSPKVRFNAINSDSNTRNIVFSSSRYNSSSGYFDFDVYHNIFIDTSSNTVYLCDNLGRPATEGSYSNWCLNVINNNLISSQNSSIYVKSFSSTPYNTSADVFLALSHNPQLLISGINDGYFYPCLSDFVLGLYVGDSWSNRVDWTENVDLGFIYDDSLQYLNPKQDVVFDLKGFVHGILDAFTEVNTPIALKDVALQNTYFDNEQIQAQDLQPTAFNVTPPASGVNIPEGLFSGLLDNGGFVSYLWYMTKPLISFTGDLIDALTFDGFVGADPVTGATVHFSGSGPGQIFIGVVCVGLIGGLVVKCLL